MTKYKITTEVIIESLNEQSAIDAAIAIHAIHTRVGDLEFDKDNIKSGQTDTTLEKESWSTVTKW